MCDAGSEIRQGGREKKKKGDDIKGIEKRSFSVVRIRGVFRGYSLLLVGHTHLLDGVVGEVLFRLNCTLPRVPHYLW